MRNQQAANQAEKIGSATIGPALAYFLVPILKNAGWIQYEDKALAVTMGATIVTWLLLQIRTALRWLAGLIEHNLDRIDDRID